MHDLYYFRHYITELQNPNIAAFFKRWGAKGYGLFWYITERLFDDPANMLPYSKEMIHDLSKATKISRVKVRLMLIDMSALRLLNINKNTITCDRVENEIKEVIKSKNRRKNIS